MNFNGPLTKVIGAHGDPPKINNARAAMCRLMQLRSGQVTLLRGISPPPQLSPHLDLRAPDGLRTLGSMPRISSFILFCCLCNNSLSFSFPALACVCGRLTHYAGLQSKLETLFRVFAPFHHVNFSAFVCVELLLRTFQFPKLFRGETPDPSCREGATPSRILPQHGLRLCAGRPGFETFTH